MYALKYELHFHFQSPAVQLLYNTLHVRAIPTNLRYNKSPQPHYSVCLCVMCQTVYLNNIREHAKCLFQVVVYLFWFNAVSSEKKRCPLSERCTVGISPDKREILSQSAISINCSDMINHMYLLCNSASCFPFRRCVLRQCLGELYSDRAAEGSCQILLTTYQTNQDSDQRNLLTDWRRLY